METCDDLDDLSVDAIVEGIRESAEECPAMPGRDFWEGVWYGSSEMRATIRSSDVTKSFPRPGRRSSYHDLADMTSSMASPGSGLTQLSRFSETSPDFIPGHVSRLGICQPTLQLPKVPLGKRHLVRSGRDSVPCIAQEIDALGGRKSEDLR